MDTEGHWSGFILVDQKIPVLRACDSTLVLLWKRKWMDLK